MLYRTIRRSTVPHDARTVANQIVNISLANSQVITPMQVLKLTYFCHAWMLGLYHRPLLIQSIEAWRYGPVVRDVYFLFRHYGGSPIMAPESLAGLGIKNHSFDAQETDIIGQVTSKYGHLSGVQMSSLAHQPGSPWYDVWTQRGQNAFIPDTVIEAYYTRKAKGENLVG